MTPPPPAPSPSSRYPPHFPSYNNMSRSDSSPCCPRLSIRLGSLAALHQHSKEGEYSLVKEAGREDSLVYRQDRRGHLGDQNYIFHLSQPDWSGWLVGPQVRIFWADFITLWWSSGVGEERRSPQSEPGGLSHPGRWLEVLCSSRRIPVWRDSCFLSCLGRGGDQVRAGINGDQSPDSERF